MANNLFKWDKNCENSGIWGFGCHLGRHLEYLKWQLNLTIVHKHNL